MDSQPSLIPLFSTLIIGIALLFLPIAYIPHLVEILGISASEFSWGPMLSGLTMLAGSALVPVITHHATSLSTLFHGAMVVFVASGFMVFSLQSLTLLYGYFLLQGLCIGLLLTSYRAVGLRWLQATQQHIMGWMDLAVCVGLLLGLTVSIIGIQAQIYLGIPYAVASGLALPVLWRSHRQLARVLPQTSVDPSQQPTSWPSATSLVLGFVFGLFFLWNNFLVYWAALWMRDLYGPSWQLQPLLAYVLGSLSGLAAYARLRQQVALLTHAAIIPILCLSAFFGLLLWPHPWGYSLAFFLLGCGYCAHLPLLTEVAVASNPSHSAEATTAHITSVAVLSSLFYPLLNGFIAEQWGVAALITTVEASLLLSSLILAAIIVRLPSGE